MSFRAVDAPRSADLAVSVPGPSIRHYRDEIIADVLNWSEVSLGAEAQGRIVEPTADRREPLRLVLASSMLGSYEACLGGLGDQTTKAGKEMASGLLGLLAFSRFMDTEEFWVSADAQATGGDDWDVGIDLVERGKPRAHYPNGLVNAALGEVSAGHVKWYFDDSGLLVRRSSPAEPSRDYGFDPATRTTMAVYLSSPARLRRP